MKTKRPISELLIVIVSLKLVIEVINSTVIDKFDNIWVGLCVLIITILFLRYVLNCCCIVFEYVVDYIKGDE